MLEKTVTSGASETIRRERAKARVWFYKPWACVGKLAFIGHDEWARRTLVIGFGFTGRIIIALRGCGDNECVRQAIENVKWLRSEEAGDDD